MICLDFLSLSTHANLTNIQRCLGLLKWPRINEWIVHSLVFNCSLNICWSCGIRKSVNVFLSMSAGWHPNKPVTRWSTNVTAPAWSWRVTNSPFEPSTRSLGALVIWMRAIAIKWKWVAVGLPCSSMPWYMLAWLWFWSIEVIGLKKTTFNY